jgi:ribonuclease P protein component
MPDARFPKRLRLVRATEFERVFAARNSAANAWLAMYGAKNDVGHPRLGITVSRKVGGAVQRNRWKRLLREAFRLTQHELPAIDIVCTARSPAPPALGELKQALTKLANRIANRAQKTKPPAEDPRS